MKFKQINGQANAIEQLLGAIAKERTSHAYLFSGPEGVGKFKTALAFANALNCENPTGGDSCGQCISCRKFLSGNNPMVTPIEVKGSSIKIEQIRELQERLKYSISQGNSHVVIIREAHKVTLQGANSLLKAIEEPPPNTIFILTTNQQYSLLPTILSRCQVIKFNLLDHKVLEGILADEEIGTEERRLACLLAKGSARKAISLCQSDEITAWQKQAWEAIRYIFGKEYLAIMEKVEYWDGEKYSLPGIVDTLAVWYRDYLVWTETGVSELLIDGDRIADFESYNADINTIITHLELVTKYQKILQTTANEKNSTEALLLSLSRIA